MSEVLDHGTSHSTWIARTWSWIIKAKSSVTCFPWMWQMAPVVLHTCSHEFCYENIWIIFTLRIYRSVGPQVWKGPVRAEWFHDNARGRPARWKNRFAQEIVLASWCRSSFFSNWRKKDVLLPFFLPRQGCYIMFRSRIRCLSHLTSLRCIITPNTSTNIHPSLHQHGKNRHLSRDFRWWCFFLLLIRDY